MSVISLLRDWKLHDKSKAVPSPTKFLNAAGQSVHTLAEIHATPALPNISGIGSNEVVDQVKTINLSNLTSKTPENTPIWSTMVYPAKIATSEQPVEPVETHMSFLGVLEAIGKGFEKGLVWAIKYAVPVEKLIGLIFPAALPVTVELADATTLIQNAVLLVEQKYAASGVQSGTGAQKSAEVLALTEQAVTGLLTKAGVTTATTDYIQSIINAVVAILNVQGFVAAPAAVTPAS